MTRSLLLLLLLAPAPASHAVPCRAVPSHAVPCHAMPCEAALPARQLHSTASHLGGRGGGGGGGEGGGEGIVGTLRIFVLTTAQKSLSSGLAAGVQRWESAAQL